MSEYTISLIMTTRNRHQQVERLLKSLTCQKLANFQLIAGLQNPNEALLQLVKKYQSYFPIEIVSLSACSLSQARNQLLPFASGEIIALTDDDCWYPENFTERVETFFRTHHTADACIGSAARQRKPHPQTTSIVSRYNVFYNAPSWLLFFRKSAVLRVGPFDETLGIGASTPWQSGEETDYCLRLLQKEGQIFRTHTITVMHPETSPSDTQKCFLYGLGRMKTLHKHTFPLWFVLLNIFYPLIKLPTRPPRYWSCYMAFFKGRLRGFQQLFLKS